MMVFSEMRPPVAAEDGNTPLRGKNVGKLLDMAAAEYADESGFRLTKDQILKNYTDDASLADKNWNVRHHVTPSAFNGANHKYYKVSSFALFHKQMTNSLARSSPSVHHSNTSTKTSRTSRMCTCSRRGS